MKYIWTPGNTLYMLQQQKGKLLPVTKRPAVEAKGFNEAQWSGGSEQSLWKQVFPSPLRGAHGWCRRDEQVEQRVHRESVRTSRYSEEPLSLFRSLLMQTAHLYFSLTWSLRPHSICDQIPVESCETAADKETKQKLLEERVRRCGSHQPWKTHERDGRQTGQED